jgi:hypothetical protein
VLFFPFSLFSFFPHKLFFTIIVCVYILDKHQTIITPSENTYICICDCLIIGKFWSLLEFGKIGCYTSNKLLIYKTILKPNWTYGIQLWGTASTSNIEILERFQSKALRIIVGASWYVPNMVIRRDHQISTVKEEINCYSSQYSARLSAHPNDLIVILIELPDHRRLLRHLPNDLPTRFLV